MSEEKHTPGPWIADLEDLPPGRDIVIAAPDMSGTHLAAVFTEWGPEDRPHEEGWANARLIAAAPDLLAACEGALECLEDEGYEDGGEHYIVTRLKAAIARAKGEQR